MGAHPAALDPQDHFVGVVGMKATAAAGSGAAAAQAILVPADAVRAFLQAQHISPASGAAAVEQSALRVICVRK